MVHNALNLNQDKSELLVFSSKFLAEPELNCINVVDQRIKFVLSARNLGVVFVSFSFSSDHILRICKSAQFSLNRGGGVVARSGAELT